MVSSQCDIYTLSGRSPEVIVLTLRHYDTQRDWRNHTVHVFEVTLWQCKATITKGE